MFFCLEKGVKKIFVGPSHIFICDANVSLRGECKLFSCGKQELIPPFSNTFFSAYKFRFFTNNFHFEEVFSFSCKMNI